MSPKKMGCGLVVLAAITALSGSVAAAQNLDRGKPAPKLITQGMVESMKPGSVWR